MMIHAYNESYLDDAMQTLAEVFSYVDNSIDLDRLYDCFIMSGIAHQFERGNPRYLTMPSHVLFNEIVDGKIKMVIPDDINRTKQYWSGWILAYYQWYTSLSFEIIKDKLPPSRIMAMYHPLHESSNEKFVDVANSIIYQKDTNLAIYRKYANMSQNQLSKYSNVSLRSIQLYEQRKLDINLAPTIKLYQLARVLGCNIEDLLEKI